MAVEVLLDDTSSTRPVDHARLKRLALGALEAEGLVGDAELSVHFVDEVEIAELNAQHLGRKGPTDVLSFPIEDDPLAAIRSRPAGRGSEPQVPSAPVLLGDVVICPEVAWRNAPDHAGSYEDELALLLVHGILHLLGYDHVRDDEAEVMEAREQQILDACFREGGTAGRSSCETSGAADPPSRDEDLRGP